MASVALVIPVLNGSDYLTGLFDALDIHWDAHIGRVHVLDNASDDDTFTVAEAGLPGHRGALTGGYEVTSFSENRGFAPAVNTGIVSALANPIISHVCIFNVDQLVRKNWLMWLLAALDRFPRLGMVGPLIIENMMPEEYRHAVFPHLEEGEDLRIQHRRREAPHEAKGCPWLYRREALEEVGLFDEQMAYAQMEDSDHMLRLTLAGWEYAKVCNSPAYHYVGSRGQQEARRRLGGRDFAMENRVRFEAKWGTFDFQDMMPEPIYRNEE